MLKLGGRASDYFHFPMELWQTSRVPLSSVETNRAGTSALRFVNMITPRFGVLALRARKLSLCPSGAFVPPSGIGCHAVLSKPSSLSVSRALFMANFSVKKLGRLEIS